jgi:pyruvate dehydrogenase E1 component alpha subunit
LLEKARNDRRPAVLEAMTYRHRGHSVADAGLAYRDKEEVASYRARDPLTRARALLLEQGVGEAQLAALDAAAQERVAAAVEFASADPEPQVSDLAVGMYAPGSAEQFSRMVPGSPLDEQELVFAGGLGR